MRWASLVRDRGYRLSFAHGFRNAEEVLEIRIPPHAMPVSRIHHGVRVVWETDCIGHTRVFLTLAEALIAVVPLSAGERRAVLKPRTPSWLPFAGEASDGRPGPLRRWLGGLARAAGLMSGR